MRHLDRQTRLRKFDKRRKNTKSISMLIIFAAILIVLLIGLWLLTGTKQSSSSPSQLEDQNYPPAESNDTNKANDEQTDEQSPNEQDTNDQNNHENEEQPSSEETDTNYSVPSDNQDVEKEDASPIDPEDENVVESYTGSWHTIPTELTEPNYYDFNEESQNRIEIEQAVRHATGLPEDMTVWWLANGGDKKVIATVATRDETEIYRVYVEWQDNEGWQPILVERLQENDQKWRFEDNNNDTEDEVEADEKENS